ncbi:MAG: BatA domain-containing protein, partial [candidate division Zixibacteria bacterium]|nr:BatA domain-containing protein [candidate division Zixibacteria bacterium]
MHWGNPNILWGLLLAPAVALFFLWSERAKQKTKFKFGNLKLVELLESNHSPQKAFRKKTLLLAAISFLIICLAQPQWGSQLVEVKKQGVDLVFAVDVSSSMLAEDILPNRLERSKLEISNLLDKLQGDRVG